MNAKQKLYWDEDYIKDQLKAGKDYLDIANDNGVGRSTLQRVLHHYKLTKPSIPWTNQEISQLKEYYGHVRDFKKYFPRRNLGSLYHKANRLSLRSHLKPRRYSVNELFFKRWDKKMAYVLGWMFSDGNVTPDKRTFRIKLSIRDAKILKKIRSILKSAAPLKICEQKLPSGNGFGKYISLIINSYPMCEDLFRLGCTARKTDKCTVPQMPSAFLKDFVRGYFDGDGSILFNAPNTIKIRFVSASDQFIKNLTRVFTKELGIQANYKKIDQSNLWQGEYYGSNARKICKWMYSGCDGLCLDRKKLRFDNHLEKRRNNA